MPKPFFITPFIRNFAESGNRFGKANTPYDRRVDWVSGDPRSPISPFYPYDIPQVIWNLDPLFVWRAEPQLIAHEPYASYDPDDPIVATEGAARLVDAGPGHTLITEFSTNSPPTYQTPGAPITAGAVRFETGKNLSTSIGVGGDDRIAAVQNTGVFALVWRGVFNTDPSTTTQTLMCTRATAAGWTWQTNLNAGADDLSFYIFDGSITVECNSGDIGLTNGELYTLAVIGDGVNVSMTVNGTEVATDTMVTDANPSAKPLSIGRVQGTEVPLLADVIGVYISVTATPDGSLDLINAWFDEVQV